CKTGKPIFLLSRLVESTLEEPPGRIRVSHASVMVQTEDFRFEIADFRFQSLDQPNLQSQIYNLKSTNWRLTRRAWCRAVRWRGILSQSAGCSFPAKPEYGWGRTSAGPGRRDGVS